MNNREQTKHSIAVMQGALDGGHIQCAKRNKFNQGSTQWVSMDHCPRYWNWKGFQYRIIEDAKNEC